MKRSFYASLKAQRFAALVIYAGCVILQWRWVTRPGREIVQVLEQRLGESDLLDEHILWAITQQQQKREQLVVEVQPAQQKRLVRAVEKGLPRDA